MLVLYVVTHNYLRDQTFETSSNNANRLLAFWSEFPKDAALFGIYHHINMTHDPGNEKTHQWIFFVNATTRFFLKGLRKGKILELHMMIGWISRTPTICFLCKDISGMMTLLPDPSLTCFKIIKSLSSVGMTV